MSGKKRFHKPGSLQPNIDDILRVERIAGRMHLIRQAHQEKAEFYSKIARVLSYWEDAWQTSS
ncbi:MAG: hypothetical protein ACLUD0_19275 [Eubacterium ramulus]